MYENKCKKEKLTKNQLVTSCETENLRYNRKEAGILTESQSENEGRT